MSVTPNRGGSGRYVQSQDSRMSSSPIDHETVSDAVGELGDLFQTFLFSEKDLRIAGAEECLPYLVRLGKALRLLT